MKSPSNQLNKEANPEKTTIDTILHNRGGFILFAVFFKSAVGQSVSQEAVEWSRTIVSKEATPGQDTW